MRVGEALEEVAAYVPEDFSALKERLDPKWIEEALALAGVATIRRRRLPADQVLWLVICMGLVRQWPIETIVDELGLALPDERRTLVARSSTTEARQRLGEDPLAYLFAITAAE